MIESIILAELVFLVLYLIVIVIVRVLKRSNDDEEPALAQSATTYKAINLAVKSPIHTTGATGNTEEKFEPENRKVTEPVEGTEVICIGKQCVDDPVVRTADSDLSPHSGQNTVQQCNPDRTSFRRHQRPTRALLIARRNSSFTNDGTSEVIDATRSFVPIPDIMKVFVSDENQKVERKENECGVQWKFQPNRPGQTIPLIAPANTDETRVEKENNEGVTEDTDANVILDDDHITLADQDSVLLKDSPGFFNVASGGQNIEPIRPIKAAKRNNEPTIGISNTRTAEERMIRPSPRPATNQTTRDEEHESGDATMYAKKYKIATISQQLQKDKNDLLRRLMDSSFRNRDVTEFKTLGWKKAFIDKYFWETLIKEYKDIIKQAVRSTNQLDTNRGHNVFAVGFDAASEPILCDICNWRQYEDRCVGCGANVCGTRVCGLHDCGPSTSRAFVDDDG